MTKPLSELGLELTADRGKRSRRGLGCLALLLVLAAIAGGLYWAASTGIEAVRDRFSDPEDYAGPGSGRVLVEVQEGDNATDIGKVLVRKDVVASLEAFTDAALTNPDSTGIQVGFYELQRQMPAAEALEVLVDPDNLLQSAVTVPEGLRVEQVVEILAKETDFGARQFRRALDQPEKLGLPGYARGNPEGYLFPATYTFRPNDRPADMLAAMVDRWRQAAEEADLEAAADRLGYTPSELMIVASLVESEANRDEDRGKVARVIYNRLETDATDGLLQIDATVNYALGRDLGLALTEEDLAVDSPYNTRRYPGLPPGPIESPGDAAIAAAADPTPGPWVYYVTVDLDSGETKFTESYDEFLRFKNVELAEYCAGSDRC